MQVARLADRSLIPVTEGKGALAEFAASRVEDIKALIAEHGVLLFRGFDVLDGGGLGDVMTNLFGRSMDYLFRSTPRTAVGGKVFTATEYPRNHAIPLHSELSYHRDWPMHLIFGCVQPAEQGGATPIADLRAVTRRLGRYSMPRRENSAMRACQARPFSGGPHLNARPASLPWASISLCSRQ